MSTTEELREVLDRHAAAVDDHELHARSRAVHERVRVVRRRRRGAAAAALAVVLVGAGLGVLPALRGGAPEPAGPPQRLAGHEVPARTTVYGFGYRLAETVPPAKVADGPVRLPASTPGRVVSLVTDRLGRGVATLFANGQPVARSRGDHGSLERPVPLSDQATTLRVRLHGAPAGASAGLAVYERDGRMPDGVSNGSAVFRRSVAGTELLAARFGEPGQTSVRFAFTGSLGDVSFAQDCAHVPAHWQVRVSVGGDGYLASGCDGQEDAGHADFSLDGRSGAVRRHTVRIWLAPERGYDRNDLATPDRVVLGLGVYRLQASDRVVGGMRVPSTVEADGRTWGLVAMIGDGSGSHELAHTFDTTDGPLAIGFTSSGGHLGLRTDGRLVPATETGAWSENGPDLMGPDTVLLAGDRYRVSLTEERPGRTFRATLLVYAPID